MTSLTHNASRSTQYAVRFGTDGWRARLAEDFTFGNVRRVAWALGQFLLKESPGAAVLVGFDQRFGSDEFASEAASVLAGLGVATFLADSVLPTPAFSYLAKKRNCYALVVTASHNPPMDNGLKVKIPQGASAPQSLTNKLEQLIREAPDSFNKTRCLRDATLRIAYKRYLVTLTQNLKNKLKGKRVVIDYFHGASSGLLEELLGERTVIALRRERDPFFGGIAPEPIEKNLKELKLQVKSSHALIGVALDGDGDRISVVDEKGGYLAPTTVFPLYAYYHALVRKDQGEIVQGVSLGYLGELIAQKAGLPFCWVPVGFKNIAERMHARDVLLAGEESGGYALGKLVPDRDGLVNTILLLRILTELKLKPSELVKRIFKEFGSSFYKRFDFHTLGAIDRERFTHLCKEKLVPLIKKRGLKTVHQLEIDGLKLFFDNGSWLLLRPSGTEPLIRLYAETPCEADTEELINLAQDWIREQNFS